MKMIATCSLDRVIGINGAIPWQCKEDLARFKRLTMGGEIVMGRRTFESLGCKPLIGRLNVVITSKPAADWDSHGVLSFRSISEYLAVGDRATDNDSIWFIGGERIFTETLPLVKEIYLTEVQYWAMPEDRTTAAYFPGFSDIYKAGRWNRWRLESTVGKAFITGTEKSVPAEFLLYERDS